MRLPVGYGEEMPRIGVDNAEEQPVDKKPCLSCTVQQLIIQQATAQVTGTGEERELLQTQAEKANSVSGRLSQWRESSATVERRQAG